MRISRIQIENFRNFKYLDVAVDINAVIVGENKVGKSNLLHALRLVLDPTMPDSARALRSEDFWDGLDEDAEKRITVAVELSDWEGNHAHEAWLSDYLVSHAPLIAKLTYVFQPKPNLIGRPTKSADFHWFIFGGSRREETLTAALRHAIPLDVLPALRDAESTLANWRGSPLRPLLDHVSANIDRDTLVELAHTVTTAAQNIRDVPQVLNISETINTRLTRMVGPSHAVATELNIAPTDPDSLIRGLRLFIDGGLRSAAEASTGTANLLYITLKQLELEFLVADHSREHTFWAIEEPEAHLHPHLQRLVYRDFLRPRQHLTTGIAGHAASANGTSMTKVLTTHSPHIVSISPVKSLVLLRRSPENGSTEGFSTANLPLANKEVDDLERYLDVTRGEIVFARGVLLVEGEAEQYIVPTVARLLGYDFDELGISVCSVAGTNFAPFCKLLGRHGLNIPFAVLTDSDPLPNGKHLGRVRVHKLFSAADVSPCAGTLDSEEFLKYASECGFFLNSHTLEIDLVNGGQRSAMLETLSALTQSKGCRARVQQWKSGQTPVEPKRFLRDIEAVGKGRFAQRLASYLTDSSYPEYLSQAISYIAKATSGKHA
jgi:putative ATP-dependent endonuclease of OLD family